MMRVVASGILVACVLGLIANVALAQSPPRIPLQGTLTDADGGVINGGTDVTFTLYSNEEGSLQLWAETQTIDVANGYFSTFLGQELPLDLSAFRDYSTIFLGVTVANDAEMPLIGLATVPYAGYATYCGDSASFDGKTSNEFYDAFVAQLPESSHLRYDDAEAVAAMGDLAAANPLNHDRFSQSEAVQSMGGRAETNPLNHDRYTDAEAISAVGAHYSDADAVAAVAATDAYVTKGGDSTMAGALTVGSLDLGNGHVEEVTMTGTGDLTIPLGRFSIGTAITIEAYIAGGWAEDGGIYHIVGDWSSLPRVVLRNESSISSRLRFYGALDGSPTGNAFLFATWDNTSPGETSANSVTLRMSASSAFDTANTGDFTLATELESVLVINDSGNVGIGTTAPAAKLDVAGNLRVSGTIDAPHFMAQAMCGAMNTNFDYGRAFKVPGGSVCATFCANEPSLDTKACVGGLLADGTSTARFACTFTLPTNYATGYCCCR